MPLYTFVNPDDTEVTQDIFFAMADAPSIGSIVTFEGVKWKRIAVKPQASFDTKCDPNSVDDFLKVTHKRNSIGDMFDRSKELSMKRQEKEGVDTVQQGYLQDYSRRRRGKKHPVQRRAETVASLAKSGIKVDFGNDD
jgi:hypothetical protein